MKDIKMTWHDTPEEVHRAMWEPVAIEDNVTYAELCGMTGGGTDAEGNIVEFTFAQEMEAIRQMGVFGFADTMDRHIHAWADPSTPRETVIHMLAHQIGHLTGTPCEDDLQEAMRAASYGAVASMAFSLLPTADGCRNLKSDLTAIEGTVIAADIDPLMGNPSMIIERSNGSSVILLGLTEVECQASAQAFMDGVVLTLSRRPGD